MKKLLLGAALLALGAAPVFAADMAVKARPMADPIMTYNWTGFYVGADIGARWTDANWNTTCLQPGFVAACSPGNFPARLAFNNPSTYDSTSAKGGIYGGYNWQVNPTWVLGVEGDFQWGDNKRTKAGIPGAEAAALPAPGLDISSIRQTWDASLRARAGFLVSPSVLLFGTGGVAFTHVESSAFCGSAFGTGWCNGGGPFLGTTQTASADRVGWTAGAGIEAMLSPNWLVRGEYRYADYGTFGSTIFTGFNGAAVNGDAIAFDTRIRTHTATVGIAYKFGGPVVARY